MSDKLFGIDITKGVITHEVRRKTRHKGKVFAPAQQSVEPTAGNSFDDDIEYDESFLDVALNMDGIEEPYRASDIDDLPVISNDLLKGGV